MDFTRARQIVGAVSLGAVAIALSLASVSVHRDNVAMRSSALLVVPLVIVSVVTAAAAFAVLRSSVFAQIAARGVAWLVFVSASYALWRSDVFGWRTAGLAIGCGVMLAVSRPVVDRLVARSEFAPRAYRRWFLTGAVGAITGATTTGLTAAGAWIAGDTTYAIVLGSLAACLVAASSAVLRMRDRLGRDACRRARDAARSLPFLAESPHGSYASSSMISRFVPSYASNTARCARNDMFPSRR